MPPGFLNPPSNYGYTMMVKDFGNTLMVDQGLTVDVRYYGFRGLSRHSLGEGGWTLIIHQLL